jgi:hypothetical protein
MTKPKNKKPDSTPKNADRDKCAPEMTGAALIKVMQDPCVRDLEFERPGVRSPVRRVKI